MAHGKGKVHKPHRLADDQMKKVLSVQKKEMKNQPKLKIKAKSIKSQIRSVERLLKKGLTGKAKEIQENRLEELKREAGVRLNSQLERKMALRYRKVKFFERRKIERKIEQLERHLVIEKDGELVSSISGQLAQLKEDLEYVRFFPKNEKYVSLFMGKDDELVCAKRKELRERIKANIAAAKAAGVEMEETENPDLETDNADDTTMDMGNDDFFIESGGDDEMETELVLKRPSRGSQPQAHKGKKYSGNFQQRQKDVKIGKGKMNAPNSFNKGAPMKIGSNGEDKMQIEKQTSQGTAGQGVNQTEQGEGKRKRKRTRPKKKK